MDCLSALHSEGEIIWSTPMILKGKCGFFNPVLLECLWDVQEELKEETDIQTVDKANQHDIRGMATEIMKTLKQRLSSVKCLHQMKFFISWKLSG